MLIKNALPHRGIAGTATTCEAGSQNAQESEADQVRKRGRDRAEESIGTEVSAKETTACAQIGKKMTAIHSAAGRGGAGRVGAGWGMGRNGMRAPFGDR